MRSVTSNLKISFSNIRDSTPENFSTYLLLWLFAANADYLEDNPHWIGFNLTMLREGVIYFSMPLCMYFEVRFTNKAKGCKTVGLPFFLVPMPNINKQNIKFYLIETEYF